MVCGAVSTCNQGLTTISLYNKQLKSYAVELTDVVMMILDQTLSDAKPVYAGKACTTTRRAQLILPGATELQWIVSNRPYRLNRGWA
jgi:hypothetical protein